MMWQQKQIEMLNLIPHNHWVDLFFSKFFYVDSAPFVLLVICFVWKIIDPKLGVRLFYLMVLSFVVNALAKLFFHMPRPCQIDPANALICLTNYGFPSGAAQSAAIYFGFTFLETKKRIYRLPVFLFGCVLCFSRLYLKVHFFTDILGGLLFGTLLVIFYRYGFPFFEKKWKFWSLIFPLSISLINPSLFLPCSLLSFVISICLLALESNKVSYLYFKHKIIPFIFCVLLVFAILFFSVKMPYISILLTGALGYLLVLSKEVKKHSF